MIIKIADIIKSDGASLDVEFNDIIAGLNGAADGFELKDPVSFKGKLTNISGVLKLDGCLKTSFTSKRYKCLKDIGLQMTIELKEDFVDGEKVADPETYTYVGNYITLDKTLEDNIILNLPMRQVCSELCKGLCTKCGNDFNMKECECQEEESTDTRLESLKNFFNS